MNILIFIHSLSSGGAERVTANLANYWAEKGWSITVVTLASKELDFFDLHPAVERTALNLADESRHPFDGVLNNLRRIFFLRKVLRQTGPDIALAMMSTANILLTFAAMGMVNLKTVGSEHTHPPCLPLGRLWGLLRRLVYIRLSAIAVLTTESANWIEQHIGAQKIAIIPNAVPYPLSDQSAFMLTPPFWPDKKVLLAVGRLSEEKGFDLLLKVFAAIAADIPDWRLVILGEGPDRSALEEQIHETKISDRVLLPGRVGNVGQWYKAADLYVMSSRFEGFGNTLAEALAYGLPAVSFDCDAGPRDIIRHEVDGLLVPAEDAGALEAALRRLMQDEKGCSRFVKRAIEARERFSMEKIAGMWEKLFIEVRDE